MLEVEELSQVVLGSEVLRLEMMIEVLRRAVLRSVLAEAKEATATKKI